MRVMALLTSQLRKNNVCFIIVGLVLLLNICILTSLICIYYNISEEDADLKCFICNESLSSSPSCCTKYQTETAQRLQRVIEKKVAERLDNWQPVQWQKVQMENWTAVLPLPKPAAHLIVNPALKMQEHIPNKDGLYTIDSWKTSINNAFLGNGVNLWDGCIVMPVDGLYFVYSQVHFIKSRQSKGDNEVPLLLHTIQRHSHKTQTVQSLIRQSEAMPDPGPNGITEKSSYISSTSKLHAGDHLCVLVNHIQLVHLNPASTYFGMYLQ